MSLTPGVALIGGACSACRQRCERFSARRAQGHVPINAAGMNGLPPEARAPRSPTCPPLHVPPPRGSRVAIGSSIGLEDIPWRHLRNDVTQRMPGWLCLLEHRISCAFAVDTVRASICFEAQCFKNRALRGPTRLVERPGITHSRGPANFAGTPVRTRRARFGGDTHAQFSLTCLRAAREGKRAEKKAKCQRTSVEGTCGQPARGERAARGWQPLSRDLGGTWGRWCRRPSASAPHDRQRR
ncbi:hypothetical protein HPB51_020036 [Rhipicephalus microplus]|uniref:Uncharacterized protein n=1 Tax=Rhipicephalus microplus TaxID=6941 RepID=A0A9J6DBM8_RHIMP|nr:hypothetical protein HPB51_020036 [Rhipicephalus microplus]